MNILYNNNKMEEEKIENNKYEEKKRREYEAVQDFLEKIAYIKKKRDEPKNKLNKILKLKDEKKIIFSKLKLIDQRNI